MTTTKDSSFLNEHVRVGVRVQLWLCASLRRSPLGDAATDSFTGRRMSMFICQSTCWHHAHTCSTNTHLQNTLLSSTTSHSPSQPKSPIGFQPSPNAAPGRSLISLFTRLPSYLLHPTLPNKAGRAERLDVVLIICFSLMTSSCTCGLLSATLKDKKKKISKIIMRAE